MEESKKVNVIEVAIVIFIIVVATTLIVFTYSAAQNENVHHLKDMMASNTTASDDYRQGWNDCIKELEHYQNRSVNTTGGKV
jgi:cell division protein FtsL